MHVALVGWELRDAERELGGARASSYAKLSDALRQKPVVIVLSTARLDAVPAATAATHIDRLGPVVLVAGPTDGEAVRERWEPTGAVEFVTDPARRVRRMHAHGHLRRLSLHDWLGVARLALRPTVVALLRHLPRLERLEVRAWSAAVCVSRRTLARRLERAFPHSPRALIRDYRLRSARALLAAGHPLRIVASGLGYSGESSLCRALRRFEPLRFS